MLTVQDTKHLSGIENISRYPGVLFILNRWFLTCEQ